MFNLMDGSFAVGNIMASLYLSEWFLYIERGIKFVFNFNWITVDAMMYICMEYCTENVF